MKKFLFILLAIFTTGCASVNHRVHDNHPDYFRASKTIVIAEPDVKVYQLSAGGIDQYMQDWSDKAYRNFLSALQEEINSFPLVKSSLMEKTKFAQNELKDLEEQEAMFNAVSSSMITHTYDPMNMIPDKRKHFQYTLGNDFSKLNELTDAEAVLFASGRNYIWTGGRVMMYIFAAAVFGDSANYIVPVGNEYVLISIVDKQSGDVVWFNYLPIPGDLRNPDVVKKQVKRMFKDFRKTWVEQKKK